MTARYASAKSSVPMWILSCLKGLKCVTAKPRNPEEVDPGRKHRRTTDKLAETVRDGVLTDTYIDGEVDVYRFDLIRYF